LNLGLSLTLVFIASPKGELLIQSLEMSPLDGAGESPLGLDLRFQILSLRVLL